VLLGRDFDVVAAWSVDRLGRSLVVEHRIRTLRAQGPGMLKVAKLAGCGVSVVQRAGVGR
jgi:hypothetical protein